LIDFHDAHQVDPVLRSAAQRFGSVPIFRENFAPNACDEKYHLKTDDCYNNIPSHNAYNRWYDILDTLSHKKWFYGVQCAICACQTNRPGDLI
jgi:hypothetical protein